MDIDSKNKLQVILNKGIAEFTEHDIAFIKARASYLTKEQLEKVSHVFLDTLTPPSESQIEELQNMPIKKVKRLKKY